MNTPFLPKFLKLYWFIALFLACSHVPYSAQSQLLEVSAITKSTPGDHLVFSAEVDWESVTDFVKALSVADQLGKPIIVEVNTPGGSIFAGFQMSRAIEATKNPVICVVDGMAASMGLYILQSCDVRVMTHRSLLMGHEPSSGASGQSEEIKKVANILEKLNLVMAAHITFRTTMSIQEYMKAVAHGGELWLTADEALKLKAIDMKVSSLKEALQLYL